MLSKQRERRYQGINELLIDLRELKQELESSSEWVVGDRSKIAERAGDNGRTDAETSPSGEVRSITAPATSSGWTGAAAIKRHKLGVSLTLLALVAVGLAAFIYFSRKPTLTDKDTILLADVVNTTGEANFDATLKQGLALQLEESPFLNIYSNDGVRQTLRSMARSPDDRVTPDVAREICQRQGLKAFLVPSISSLGSQYVIGLEAVSARTGDVIAREQEGAGSKEQLLSVLGIGASKLRRNWGSHSARSNGSISRWKALPRRLRPSRPFLWQGIWGFEERLGQNKLRCSNAPSIWIPNSHRLTPD
jgi:hypothetical protein